MSSTVFKYSGGIADATSSSAILASTSYTNASSLTAVIVGTVVTTISVNAFNGRSSLVSVTFDGVPALTTILSSAFANSGITSFTFPSSVTAIATSLFLNCAALTSCVYPSISTIPSNTFSGCTGLTSFNIPNSVTAINTSSFNNCGVSTLIIPPGVTTFGSNVFSNNGSRLKSLQFVNQSSFATVGTTNFANNSSPFTITYYSYSGSLTTASTTLQSQAPSGTEFVNDPNPICFHAGTLIRCLSPEDGKVIQVPVENLVEGETLVDTFLHGPRRVSLLHRGVLVTDPNHFNKQLFVMKASPENELIEDLVVTGGYGVLVDAIEDSYQAAFNREFYKGQQPVIDGKLLLLASVSRDFKPFPAVKDDAFYIFNFCLENEGDNDRRFGVWANGLLVETPSVNQIQLM